ncbi:MAG: hypothetical protein GY869_11800, partial [Planctomycetes bacterium]|nr:hypothetical protein [Planctomycetota bacterium]
NVMIAGRAQRFGEQIKVLAKKHKVRYLGQYGKAIINHTDSFDDVGIENKLDELADAIELLNKRWEEFNAK